MVTAPRRRPPQKERNVAVPERTRMRGEALQICHRLWACLHVLPHRIARTAVDEREAINDLFQLKPLQVLPLVIGDHTCGPLDGLARDRVEIVSRHASDNRLFVIAGDGERIEITHGGDAFRRVCAVTDRVTKHPGVVEFAVRVGQDRFKGRLVGVYVREQW